MNEEAQSSSAEPQDKLINQDDANSPQDADKKIEIVAEVSNLLNNLVKKVEKSDESDNENPSDDENIFKTESKVNDLEKIENEIEKQNEEQKENQHDVKDENQNEEEKEDQNYKDEDQNDDKNENQNEDKNENQSEDKNENRNEAKNNNSNAENDVLMDDEKREKGVLEFILRDKVTSIINTQANEVNANGNEENADNNEENTNNNEKNTNNNEEIMSGDQGVLESLISSSVNAIANGKVDISTETDHKEKKASSKKSKNQDQDKTQPDSQTDQKEINNEFSEADIQKALDDMLKKKLLPDIKIRPDVISYARRVCDEKMMNEEYDQAINIDIAIDIMFTSLEDSLNTQKQQVNENVIRRLQQTKERKEEVEKNWNDRINEQKNINSQKVLELSKSHEKEKTAFIEEWNNPQTLVAFSKPSAKLFHLRKQQKTLALVHDFEGAKILKNEADQLEKRETSENLRKAESSMKNQYLMLLDRQNREMQCLIDNSNATIEKLEMFKLKEMSSIENTEKVLQSRLPISNSISASSSNASISAMSSQSLKKNKMVLSPTVIVPNVNSNSASKIRSLNSSVLSRRARSQMASYMATNETWRLKLKMNDVSKTIRSVEPSAKNRQTTTL